MKSKRYLPQFCHFHETETFAIIQWNNFSKRVQLRTDLLTLSSCAQPVKIASVPQLAVDIFSGVFFMYSSNMSKTIPFSWFKNYLLQCLCCPSKHIHIFIQREYFSDHKLRRHLLLIQFHCLPIMSNVNLTENIRSSPITFSLHDFFFVSQRTRLSWDLLVSNDFQRLWLLLAKWEPSGLFDN